MPSEAALRLASILSLSLYVCTGIHRAHKPKSAESWDLANGALRHNNRRQQRNAIHKNVCTSTPATCAGVAQEPIWDGELQRLCFCSCCQHSLAVCMWVWHRD